MNTPSDKSELHRLLGLIDAGENALAANLVRAMLAAPSATLPLRDQLAAAALPAIYAQHTMLTDAAAALAYEQADEMLNVRRSDGTTKEVK